MSTEGFSPLKETEGFSPLKAFVIDISKKALEVSEINIEKHNLKDRIVQIH